MRSAGVDLKKVWAPGLLLVILTLLATFTLYASGYTVILLTYILMYIVLTMSWVIFAAPTGYVSLATAAFISHMYTSAI
jgi:ABC-type branched-subunit amino acid transport system permease subunit